MTAIDIGRVFAELGLSVLERGWLSSNNIVFAAAAGSSAAVVDTGYVSHSEQTCLLVERALAGTGPTRVLNTHLHSDHCGGNAALQARWGCDVWVPEPSFTAVRGWDVNRLTFDATDQRCEPFSAQHALRFGDRLRLGAAEWEVVAAPGHDPEAVMFFEPVSQVIITADALWEDRVAINFPVLAGDAGGFAQARATLDRIESLSPRICIPGHGAPFSGVAAAIERSRQRLARFEADPERHLAYAERALTLFHMLEWKSMARSALVDWLAAAPVFAEAWRDVDDRGGRASAVIDRLTRDGLLAVDAAGAVHHQP